MEFNKIAGAILMTALAAMVVSKVGDLLIPEEHFVVQRAGDTPEAPTQQPEEKDPPVAQALAQADPKKGEALVKARCGSCHTWNKGGPNRVGPNIYGVVGRDKGSHEGFNYSSAMAEAPGDWTFEDLYTFLENPQGLIRGTKMAFQLRKWEQRADVIAYLRTQHDNPPPLPKPEPAAKTEPEQQAPDGGKTDEEQTPGKAPEAKQTDPAQTAPDENKPAEKTEPEQTRPDPSAPEDATPEKRPDTPTEPEKKSGTTPPDAQSAPADNTAPDNTAPDNTAPDNTAPDNTAPDSTAPDDAEQAPNADDETR